MPGVSKHVLTSMRCRLYCLCRLLRSHTDILPSLPCSHPLRLREDLRYNLRQVPMATSLADQVRRVQTLGSQEGADLTRLRASVGLAQDLYLVLRCEPTPSRLCRHLDIFRYDGCCCCFHDGSLARPLHQLSGGE